MSNHPAATLALTCIALTSACAVVPALKQGAVEVEALAGINTITNNTRGNSTTGPTGSVAVGYMITDVIEVGGMLTGARGEVEASETDVGLDLDVGLTVKDVAAGGFLRFNLPTGMALMPFAEVAAGFGSAHIQSEVRLNGLSANESDDQAAFFYHGGIGLRLFLTENVALIGVGRYRFLDMSDVDTIEEVQALLGLSVAF